MTSRRPALLGSLAMLYIAQGVPYGLAAEYIPVLLSQAHYSRTQIALAGWLQFPWQLKVFWAHLPDQPSLRRRARTILLGLQCCLAASLALYALFDVRRALHAWFALTALAALVAATQDTFVDAMAVRALRAEERGAGNVAQVAGYRVGVLVGGAGLLLFADQLASGPTVLLAAGVVLCMAAGAFMLRDAEAARTDLVSESRGPSRSETSTSDEAAPTPRGMALVATLRHVFAPAHRPVLLVALSLKIAPHMAGPIIKPMLVHAHWTARQIGIAAVTVGTVMSLAGAALGGWLHHRMPERRVLALAAIAQTVTCIPLVIVALVGPQGLSAVVAIASEHFASGIGTTVLFAALMSATRPASAGMHYTALMSLNLVSIMIGAPLAGLVADSAGDAAAFAFAAVTGLTPLLAVRGWERAVRASSTE